MTTQADRLLLALGEGAMELPACYPPLDFPATEDALALVYASRWNLPPAAFSFEQLPKGYFGAVEATLEGGRTFGSYRIILSERLRDDRRTLVDTMLHEMIHVWQMERFNQTGKFSWLDLDFEEGLLWKRSPLLGHGPSFTRKMEEVNAEGFDVRVGIDLPVFVETDRPLFGMLLYGQTDRALLLWSRFDLSTGEMQAQILKQLRIFWDLRDFPEVALFTTSNAHVVLGYQADEVGNIPPPTKTIYVRDALAIVNSGSTDMIDQSVLTTGAST